MGIKSFNNIGITLNQRRLNNIVVKRFGKANPNFDPNSTLPVPVTTPQGNKKSKKSKNGFGNPIFMTDPERMAEVQRQMDLISEEFSIHNKSYNVMHLLRLMLELVQKGENLSRDSRKNYMDYGRSTIEDAKEVLLEMEKRGYLDIAVKRRKYHDYVTNQNALDTWNSVIKLPPKPQQQNVYYQYSSEPEHYLIPFDAGIYLQEASRPENIKLQLNSFYHLPYQDGFISIVGGGMGVDLVDFKDKDFSKTEIQSPALQNLFKYINATKMNEHLEKIYKEGTTLGGREVEPRFKLDEFVVFVDKNRNHYKVPEEFLKYLYNQYYNEDLSIEIIKSDTAPIYNRCSFYSFGHSRPTGCYLVTVRRKGEKKPLVLYRFNQNQEEMNRINF